MQRQRQVLAALGCVIAGVFSAGMVTGGGSGVGDSAVGQSLVAATPTPVPTATPTPTPTPTLARFTGTWSGPLILSTGQQGPVTGTIYAAGNTNVTFRYGSISFSGSGVLSIWDRNTSDPADDRLVGSVTRLGDGAASGSASVTLNRGPLPRS